MAWMSMILWLNISATASTSDLLEQLRAEHPELFTVPAVAPYPDHMPDPYETPTEARCAHNKLGELGRGTWIPRELDLVVQSRLLTLEAYPKQAQAVVDALVPRVVAAVADRVRADQPGYSLGTVLTWAALGLAFGAAGGVAVAVAR